MFHSENKERSNPLYLLPIEFTYISHLFWSKCIITSNLPFAYDTVLSIEIKVTFGFCLLFYFFFNFLFFLSAFAILPFLMQKYVSRPAFYCSETLEWQGNASHKAFVYLARIQFPQIDTFFTICIHKLVTSNWQIKNNIQSIQNENQLYHTC